MNILFLSSWYPTKKKPNSGIFVKEHAHAIHSVGNEVIVLALVVHHDSCLWKKEISDFIDEEGVRTVLVEVNTKFRDVIYHAFHLQYVILKRAYNKILRKSFDPDFIHSNVIFPAGVIGYFFSKYLNKKHIITEHWTRVKYFSTQFPLSYWGKKAYRNAVKILPVSRFLKKMIADSFDITNNNKFEIIGNIIDSDLFQYKPKQREEGVLRLCSIASWNKMKVPAKQPELLIKAISELQRNIPEKIQLTMVGGGDKIEDLKKMAADLHVNTVFTGFLEKKEIAKILQASDYFVHPTLIETFGVVIVEALLTGTPVICSNVAALPELISKENGILCENTVEDWTKALERACQAPFDGKAISDSIKHKFDQETIGKAITKVYDDLKSL